MEPKKLVNPLLLFMIVIDFSVVIWGFFFPDAWFSYFHNSPYIDPQGLLYRCAANWTGFLIIQTFAFLFWKKHPWLLLLVAGCRFSDVFTDTTCLIFSSNFSTAALVLFPLTGLGNIFAGCFLVYFWRKNFSAR